MTVPVIETTSFDLVTISILAGQNQNKTKIIAKVSRILTCKFRTFDFDCVLKFKVDFPLISFQVVKVIIDPAMVD